MVLVFLWALILTLGPRIEVFRLPGDFRLQDFTVFPVALLFFFLMDLRGGRKDYSKSNFLAVFTWLPVLAFLSYALFALSAGDMTIASVRVGFAMRYLELILALVITLRISRGVAHQIAGSFILGYLTGSAMNLVWIGAQLLFSFNRPALSFSSTVPSMYGPGLIGEGGVYGTGQHLFITLAILLSIAIVSSSWVLRLMVLAGAITVIFAMYEVNSRASIVSAGTILVLSFAIFLIARLGRSSGLVAIALVSITAALVAFFLLVFVPRLRPEPVIGALYQRYLDWTLPTLRAVGESHWFGLGPGGARLAIEGETHNLYALLLGDFGFLGLIVFGLGASVFLSVVVKSLEVTRSKCCRLLGILTIFVSTNILISGLAQDSLLPTNTVQATATIVGLWVATFLHEINPLSVSKHGPKFPLDFRISLSKQNLQ